MEALAVALLPYVNSGILLVLTVMLKIAWNIYQKISQIEMKLGIVVADIERHEKRLDHIEGVLYGVQKTRS